MNFFPFWVADNFMPQNLNILGAAVHAKHAPANVCKVQYGKAPYPSQTEFNISTEENIFCQHPQITCEFGIVYWKKNLLEKMCKYRTLDF